MEYSPLLFKVGNIDTLIGGFILKSSTLLAMLWFVWLERKSGTFCIDVVLASGQVISLSHTWVFTILHQNLSFDYWVTSVLVNDWISYLVLVDSLNLFGFHGKLSLFIFLTLGWVLTIFLQNIVFDYWLNFVLVRGWISYMGFMDFFLLFFFLVCVRISWHVVVFALSPLFCVWMMLYHQSETGTFFFSPSWNRNPLLGSKSELEQVPKPGFVKVPELETSSFEPDPTPLHP